MAGPRLAKVRIDRREVGIWLLLFLAACGPSSTSPGLAPEVEVVPDRESLRPGLELELEARGVSMSGQLSIPSFYLLPDESLHPELPAQFSATWSGLLKIQESGHYRFHCGPSEVQVGGVPACRGRVPLRDGLYSIVVHYRRTPGTARYKLAWESDLFPKEPLPFRFLFHQLVADQQATQIESGRRLVVDLKCTRCHQSPAPTLQAWPAPPLRRGSESLKPAWLLDWVQNPSGVRAHSRMPDLAVTPLEAHHLVTLLSSTQSQGESRDQIRQAEIRLGGELFTSVGCQACHASTIHPLDDLSDKTSFSHLIEYLQSPSSFHPQGAMPDLLLNAVEARHLAAYLMRGPPSRAPRGASRKGSPEQGLRLLSQKGCLGCHPFENDQQAANLLKGPELNRLRPSYGCLAETITDGLPDYHLSSRQRLQIGRFLEFHASNPHISPAPIHDYYETVRQLACNRCHTVDHLAAISPLSERVPELTDVGAKLTPGWLHKVLLEKERVRAWLTIRMPHFPSARIEALPQQMSRASGLDSQSPLSPSEQSELVAQGLKLISSDEENGGQNCLRCHDWGTYRAHGEGAPQLALASDRLHHGWYRRFMWDPSRVIPGTSMPSFLDQAGSFKQQGISAIWAALGVDPHSKLAESHLKTRSAPPLMLLEPGTQPKIVRWDLPGATPSAFAVSFPQGISYAFDAGTCQLLYLWRGGFLELGRSLTRKVDENRMTPTAKLVGDVLYRAPKQRITFASQGSNPVVAFKGYRLVDEIPRFHYLVGSSEVHERIIPLTDGTGVRLEFHVRSRHAMELDLGTRPDISIETSLDWTRAGVTVIPPGESTFEVELRQAQGEIE